MNSRNYCTTDYNILLNHGFMAATSTLKVWYLNTLNFGSAVLDQPPFQDMPLPWGRLSIEMPKLNLDLCAVHKLLLSCYKGWSWVLKKKRGHGIRLEFP